MTIQEIHLATGGDPDVIADFEAKIEALTNEADQISGYRTTALAEAERLQRLAESYLQRSLKLRRQVKTYEEHRDAEAGKLAATVPGEIVNDEGDIQTVLIPRVLGGTAYPIAHIYLTWGDKPQRRCNQCLRILRDATDEEIEAASAGRDVPDVRGDCPNCGDDWPSAS